MLRAQTIQGATRGIRFLLVLLMIALPVIMLCYILYTCSNTSKEMDSEFNNIVKLLKECLKKCDNKKHSTLSSPLPNDLPPRYNLMEDSYGAYWASSPPENYLSSFNCTIEQANMRQLQQDHPCVIRLIRNEYLRQPETAGT